MLVALLLHWLVALIFVAHQKRLGKEVHSFVGSSGVPQSLHSKPKVKALAGENLTRLLKNNGPLS